jgi:tRNA(Ile2) C34 agmatinyltransferase TiaS
VRSSDLPRLDRVLDLVNELFKQVKLQPAAAAEGIEAVLRNLQATAIRYLHVALGQEPDPALHQAFLNLRELKVNSSSSTRSSMNSPAGV